jgi:sugar phosphate isomerase/epimerase
MKLKIHINMPYRILLKHVYTFAEKGYNPEIYLNSDILDSYKPEDMKRIAKVLIDHNCSVTIHGPFLDLSPGAVDSEIRKATMKRLNQALEAASYFKPRAIVFHGGYNRWYYNGNKALWLERSILTWETIKKRARDLNIPIAIENIFEEEPSTLKALMDALGDPSFGICFDTGHFHLFTRVSLRQWFDALVRHFIELHLHDNFKNNDDHLPLGDGEIDFNEFFLLLRQFAVEPILTVEPHRVEDVDRSFAAIYRYLGMEGLKTNPFPAGITENLL